MGVINEWKNIWKENLVICFFSTDVIKNGAGQMVFRQILGEGY